MVQANRNQPLDPSFRVRLNDFELTKDIAAWVTSVSVDESLDNPSHFTVQLTARQEGQGEIPWSDFKHFALGATVEVSFGYGDDLETLLVGDITALAPTFNVGSPPTLSVSGYDRRYRLITTPRSRPFLFKKDSDIVRQICEGKLRVRVTDTLIPHPYLAQVNQTDLAFMVERARAIHYELRMDRDTLVFDKAAQNPDKRVRLTLDDDLVDFHPRLSLVPVTEVRVVGWDVKEKKTIVATARPDSKLDDLGGQKTALQQTLDVLGEAVETIVHAVRSQAEADELAKAHANSIALNFVTGEGHCRGRSDVRAGKILDIQGIGIFSGLYYVDATTHAYDARDGYTTAFQVKRNAS